MDRTVTLKIDKDLCIGCGLCVRVCPKDVIEIKDDKAQIVGKESLNCDHCAAVCPEGAITVGAIQPGLSDFSSFSPATSWTRHGDYDTAGLVNLMQSRRSCRNYTDKPVERHLLEDLVKTGITAPSGSNCQAWTFTLLPDRSSVNCFGEAVGMFYKKLNRTAEKKWLRRLLCLIGKPELETYYQKHYANVKQGIEEWEKGKRDILFHGAQAVIIIGSKDDASCPGDDALLATQNMLLAAHSMGLGTCLIGFAVKAMQRDALIRKKVGIPPGETPYAVMALGWPDETYCRIAGRKNAYIRYPAL